MFTKTHLALLASAILSANGALAANHRHAQRHLHLNELEKKDMVPETTTTVTDITWVTVSVDPAAATSSSVVSTSSASSTSSSASSSSYLPSSSSASSTVVPTTLLTTTAAAAAVPFETPVGNVAVQDTTTTPTETPVPATTVVPTTTADAVAYVSSVVSEVTSAAGAIATTGTSSSSSGTSSGTKRGAAYNDPTLVSALLGSDSKIAWGYNWGSSSDDLTSDIEFVPMLWGEKTVSYWATNAQAAIDAGSKYLLGPNEPDNAGQANMDPATAATFHKTHMEPFAGKAKLTAPAVTNSNVAGTSIDWLTQWIEACDGCTFSVCPVHWYNTIEAGADDLFEFLTKAGTACGSERTVWLTEFAPNVGAPSDSEISSFLETVQDKLDNDSTYSFVERYSYFYVSEGVLISNGAASSYGKTFAFS